MECTAPVEVDLATEHADVGSLERAVSGALAEVGARLWRELIARLEVSLGCLRTGSAQERSHSAACC